LFFFGLKLVLMKNIRLQNWRLMIYSSADF